MHWSEDPAFLQRTRQFLGLTQAELAREAGVKPSRIGDLEAGRRSMSTKEKASVWAVLAMRESALRNEYAVPRLQSLTKLLPDGKHPTKHDIERELSRLERQASEESTEALR